MRSCMSMPRAMPRKKWVLHNGSSSQKSGICIVNIILLSIILIVNLVGGNHRRILG